MLLKIINKKIIKKTIALTLSIYFISSIFIIVEAENYEWSVINNMQTIETNGSAEENRDKIDSTTNKTNKDELNLECQSAILIEQNSGQILYEKNCHEQLRPASVTKLMTLLIIFEGLESGQITLQDKVPCSQNAASMGGSQIWLDTREELTVDEMLKAMCVVSANDCDVQFRHYLEVLKNKKKLIINTYKKATIFG